jgi:dTDP-L-rhamnose 4-epimerase
MLKERALVIGGAGFIGGHLVDRLLAEGYRVRVLDDLRAPVHPDGKWPTWMDSRVEKFRATVGNEGLISDPLWDALRGVQVVYYLAAEQDNKGNYRVQARDNCGGVGELFSVLRAMPRERRPRKVVVAGSQAAAGEGLVSDPRRDDYYGVMPQEGAPRLELDLMQGKFETRMRAYPTPSCYCAPTTFYGATKLAQEKLALTAGREIGVPVVVLRFSIVQGARQSPWNMHSGALRVFCDQAIRGGPLTVFEDGRQSRDFLNVADAVDALVLVTEGGPEGVLNAGGGQAITVYELARAVCLEYGLDPKRAISRGQWYRVGDPRHCLSNCDRLCRLGWSPTRSVYRSVREYQKWLDDEGWGGSEPGSGAGAPLRRVR